MKYLSVFTLLMLFVACGSKKEKENTEELLTETKVEVPNSNIPFPIYDFDGLEPLLKKEGDKTYIINFWATWCKPCIEEMPYFERTYQEQKASGVEMILVSLDMPSMWEKRLVPFVKKNDLKGEVVILDDPKMNDWIPKIDTDWQGGIPATLIYNKDRRTFYPHGFTYEELNNELNKFIN
ncbi:TlpA disulfide reductase family protein [Croceitalea rosinachiae]|uniref:TlpA disulfide reductase family protein n=1 Tax=Croceitalea rosinachiae TaxID=3075596 RepID=A0ABU3AHJ4_9FLAO|nr:TlpA disulfide reductase family protein [Croceitalea sp. F388]MDT0608371.1 TlpA disulfide reductase family protein [Croceitalea sp. F388]